MSFAAEAAATYRDAGTAESVVFSTAGTATDCDVISRIDRRVENDSALVVAKSVTIRVPRTTGNATKPVKNEKAVPQTSGGRYTVVAVAETKGVWEVTCV